MMEAGSVRFIHIKWFCIGPKRDEVTGGCRELPNEELHNMYPSPNIRVVK
jgi:hypothetical protein